MIRFLGLQNPKANDRVSISYRLIDLKLMYHYLRDLEKTWLLQIKSQFKVRTGVWELPACWNLEKSVKTSQIIKKSRNKLIIIQVLLLVLEIIRLFAVMKERVNSLEMNNPRKGNLFQISGTISATLHNEWNMVVYVYIICRVRFEFESLLGLLAFVTRQLADHRSALKPHPPWRR